MHNAMKQFIPFLHRNVLRHVCAVFVKPDQVIPESIRASPIGFRNKSVMQAARCSASVGALPHNLERAASYALPRRQPGIGAVGVQGHECGRQVTGEPFRSTRSGRVDGRSQAAVGVAAGDVADRQGAGAGPRPEPARVGRRQVRADSMPAR